MKISLMNVRIFITKNEVKVDEVGNHINKWMPYYTCYATVSSESPGEMTTAGMVVDDTNLDFTIRWCKLAEAIDSTHFRVQMKDELYEIVGVDHMNYKKKAVKLKCRRANR